MDFLAGTFCQRGIYRFDFRHELNLKIMIKQKDSWLLHLKSIAYLATSTFSELSFQINNF